VYIDVYAVLAYIATAHNICYGIAERFAEDNIEVIVGLDESGAIVAPWTAQNMSNIIGRKVSGVSMRELVGDHVIGKNVLLIDGILITRDIAQKAVTAVRKIGGNIIGLGTLWNRGGIMPQDVDVPKIQALVNVKIDACDASVCQLCKQGGVLPINIDSGDGRKFIANHRQQK
jgi:orotate phosphoribosyltransferase